VSAIENLSLKIGHLPCHSAKSIATAKGARKPAPGDASDHRLSITNNRFAMANSQSRSPKFKAILRQQALALFPAMRYIIPVFYRTEESNYG
jgi:hypothetical protein